MKFRKAVAAAMTFAVLAASAVGASAYEAGKGGGDIVIFVVEDSVSDRGDTISDFSFNDEPISRSQRAGGGGGDIIIFDIVDS